MRNIVDIFRIEFGNLFSNVITIAIATGIALLPAIFTWFNVLACWDVFDNMGSLKVAVANSDDGYRSSLFPVEVNVGETVTSALRENDEIGWVITDEEDAVDGVLAGRYYAAIVIPQDFSRTMLAFYADEDYEPTQITYYANEKTNIIARKFTEAGADAVSYQINRSFAETVSEVALGLAEGVANYAESADASGALLGLASDMDAAATRMDQAQAAIVAYSGLLRSMQALAESSAELVAATRANAQSAAEAVEEGAAAAKSTAEAVSSSAQTVSSALDESIASMEALIGQIPDEGVLAETDEVVAALGKQAAAYRSVLEWLQANAANAADGAEAAGASGTEAISSTQAAVASLEALRDDLAAAATSAAAESNAETADEQCISAKQAKERAQAALAALKEQKSRFEDTVQTRAAELSAQVAGVETAASTAASALDGATAGVGDAIGKAGAKLGAAADGIAAAGNRLDESAAALRNLAAKLREALAAGDSETVRALLSSNVSTLAAALSAPVSVERTAIHPAGGFGSSMTPFYSALGLFIGALVAMVAFRPRPAKRVLEELERRDAARAEADGEQGRPPRPPRPREIFLGHFGILSFIAFAQATILSLGNIFFLQAQTLHPVLLVLCCWLAGQLFMFIMYSLVFSFANLGKGVGVILLVMQVTGCGGSYPLAILPGFIQTLSPLLPATHAVNAMRAAMFGFTGADYLTEMLVLLAFFVPFLLLGLLLHKPTDRFMAWYLARVEDSKLMA